MNDPGRAFGPILSGERRAVQDVSKRKLRKLSLVLNTPMSEGFGNKSTPAQRGNFNQACAVEPPRISSLKSASRVESPAFWLQTRAVA